MARITEKNTKAEILAAYNEAIEKLDAQESMKDNPIAQKAKEEQERVITSAENIIEKGILNDEITGQYKDLQIAIAKMKKELQDLYGIEVKANSFVALVNGYKDKAVQLENEYKELKETAVKELEDKKNKLYEEIDGLEQEKKDTLESIKIEVKEQKEILAKERKREEEEYTYTLNRTRKQEEDAWEDKKAAREKELADKEKEVESKVEYVIDLENKIKDMTEQIETLKTDIETARTEGYDKGKADANKSNAFEVRELKTKNEYEQKALQDRIAHLESSLASMTESNEILQDKLDSAYAQMKELASETVKSSGGVKILDRDNNTK